jgi:regulator of replication initiation timing
MPKKNLDGTKIADFKGVNYIGLIPVLTKAIQEQQKTIADVKQENEAVKAENQELKARLDKIEQMLAINSGQQSSASSAKLSIARLEQNAPNPFNQNTVIKYYLPQNAGSAIINITDVNGRLIKTVPVTTQGNGQLTLDGGQLTSGIYQYSLIANGKLVDTKKMVLTK